jgi:hypothetical protein
LPGFLSGLPIGALSVGGSAASNPAAVIALAGSNNGSNLHIARNLFTYEIEFPSQKAGISSVPERGFSGCGLTRISL